MKVIPIFWLWLYLMEIIPIFWLWLYLMKVIPIFWLIVPDGGYSNLLTDCTWWRLFQSFDYDCTWWRLFQSFDYDCTWWRLFLSFDYDCTWWRLFQKCAVHTKLDISIVFFILPGHFNLPTLLSYLAILIFLLYYHTWPF